VGQNGAIGLLKIHRKIPGTAGLITLICPASSMPAEPFNMWSANITLTGVSWRMYSAVGQYWPEEPRSHSP
jgi:hypothetical protein